MFWTLGSDLPHGSGDKPTGHVPTTTEIHKLVGLDIILAEFKANDDVMIDLTGQGALTEFKAVSDIGLIGSMADELGTGDSMILIDMIADVLKVG